MAGMTHMNKTSIHEYSGPHRVCNLAADQAQAELLEMRERIADLESERDSYREMAQVALTRCHHLTELVRFQRYCLNTRAPESWADFVVHADRYIENWLAQHEDAA